jgi:ribosome-binding protein aMBF1 (putative translation factor)
VSPHLRPARRSIGRDGLASPSVAAFPDMLEHDRKQAGWSMGQVASRLGVSVREYKEIEAGARSPTFETWDRICKLYGWPQTFTGGA